MTLRELKQSVDAEFAGHRFGLQAWVCSYHDDIVWVAHMGNDFLPAQARLEDALELMRAMAKRGVGPGYGDSIEVW